MKCPHCTIAIHESWKNWSIGEEKDSQLYWSIQQMKCPECKKIIVRLLWRPFNSVININSRIVHPKKTTRTPIPKEVTGAIADDYKEACLVLDDSTKASAALSRRCLQNILREKAELKNFNSKTEKIETKKIKIGDLSDEIQQVLNLGGLPSQVTNGLDAVRQIGNFAAHPIKSKSSGEIAEVEVGEAELNLDVIESLFDYYFIQPKKMELKISQLNKKLQDLGKPPVKQTLV